MSEEKKLELKDLVESCKYQIGNAQSVTEALMAGYLTPETDKIITDLVDVIFNLIADAHSKMTAAVDIVYDREQQAS